MKHELISSISISGVKPPAHRLFPRHYARVLVDVTSFLTPSALYALDDSRELIFGQGKVVVALDGKLLDPTLFFGHTRGTLGNQVLLADVTIYNPFWVEE